MSACGLCIPKIMAWVGEVGEESPRVATQKFRAARHSGCASGHSIMCSWLSMLHLHPSLHETTIPPVMVYLWYVLEVCSFPFPSTGHDENTLRIAHIAVIFASHMCVVCGWVWVLDMNTRT